MTIVPFYGLSLNLDPLPHCLHCFGRGIILIRILETRGNHPTIPSTKIPKGVSRSGPTVCVYFMRVQIRVCIYVRSHFGSSEHWLGFARWCSGIAAGTWTGSRMAEFVWGLLFGDHPVPFHPRFWSLSYGPLPPWRPWALPPAWIEASQRRTISAGANLEIN